MAYDENASFYASLLIVGLAVVAVNLVVLVTFIRFRRRILRRRSNRILFSLAFADCLVGLFLISLGYCLVTRQSWTTYRLFANIPLFGSMFVSIFSMTMLTGDRLVAVKLPLRYSLIVTSKRLCLVIAASWICPFLLNLQQYIIIIFSRRLELQIRGTVLVVFTVVGSIFLAISNSFLYGEIKKQSKKMLIFKSTCSDAEDSLVSKETDDTTGKQAVKVKKGLRNTLRTEWRAAKAKMKELKVSKECVAIIIVFILCWLPLTCYRFYYSFIEPPNNKVLRRLFLILASMSSIINPYIYFFRRKQFRKYLRLRYKSYHENSDSQLPVYPSLDLEAI